MVYPLVVLQFRKLIRQNALRIVPIDVPIGVLIVSQLKSELLNSLPNDSISTLTRAKEKLLWLRGLFCFLFHYRFTLAVRGITSILT